MRKDSLSLSRARAYLAGLVLGTFLAVTAVLPVAADSFGAPWPKSTGPTAALQSGAGSLR
ncbi:hypothetical protein BH20CHL6_BH20CHL6_14770 [soil metagenome]